MYNEDQITYFAETDFRGKRTRFGIKSKDRTRHVYVIGKTGMGKSTLLENMAVQDIQNGEGMAFIDPHGKTADLLLDYVPEHRIKDVIYFAPFDTENPISFNILEDVDPDKRNLVVSGLMSSFKKIWVDAWSSRMEYILTNTLLALIEYPGSTLLDVIPMLVNKEYRKKVVENISDPSVKSFWVDEFAKYSDRYAQEATPAIQNKIGQFTGNPLIRNILGQPKSSFDIRRAMDEKKILIMNLSKGLIGETNSNLLGGMLITKIYLAAMSRADVPPEEMARIPHFYFYVDEFQSFANESFADILSEARKYKLSLTIAHQYIAQMDESVRDAVFGNVGTTITFRVGPFDAEVLERVFAPVFTHEDIVNLGIFQVYLSLMIDGVGSKPFSAVTIPPIEISGESRKEEALRSSRALYSKPREEVERTVRERMESFSERKPRESKPPAIKRPVRKTAERRIVDRKTPERMPVDRKTAERRPVDRKTPERMPVDRKTAERRIVDRKTPERKPIERSTASPDQSKTDLWKKTAPRPATKKKGPSPKLKELLMKLEKGDVTNLPAQTGEVKPADAKGFGGTRPTLEDDAVVVKSGKTMSLGLLKGDGGAPSIVRPLSKTRKDDGKGASTERISALKDALKKAKKKDKNEVPEDVLKKILE